MDEAFTGADARNLRARNRWSLQELANRTGINKAYLSEWENGHRRLPDDQVQHLREVLVGGAPVGRAAAELRRNDEGHLRLTFVGPGGEMMQPRIAYLEWTESDGTSYKMFIGER
jgi:transcriptional regulator with XRE-family HTH domain